MRGLGDCCEIPSAPEEPAGFMTKKQITGDTIEKGRTFNRYITGLSSVKDSDLYLNRQALIGTSEPSLVGYC